MMVTHMMNEPVSTYTDYKLIVIDQKIKVSEAAQKNGQIKHR